MDRKRKPGAVGAEKVRQKKERKKKILLASATNCAKITDILRQSAGDDDEDSVEGVEISQSEQGAGALS